MISDDTGRELVYPTRPGAFNWSTKRVLCLGDSITFGVVVTPPGCAYRDTLSNLLVAAGFTGIQWVGSLRGGQGCVNCPLNGLPMQNDGHNGFTTNDINTILNGIYSGAAPVDVTINMIGTNDMIQVVEGTATITDAINDWNACFAKMIGEAPESIFFVANLVPSPGLLGADLDSFNANIGTQVAALRATGTLVYFVDQYSALDPATDFDVGTIHPLPVGYAKMATAWFNAMTAATP